MAIWYGYVQCQVTFDNDPLPTPYGTTMIVEADDEAAARQLMLDRQEQFANAGPLTVTQIEDVTDQPLAKEFLALNNKRSHVRTIHAIPKE